MASNADFIRARLEEGRAKLGGFGEPVWSQALTCLDEMEKKIERLTEELATAEELETSRLMWGDSEDW